MYSVKLRHGGDLYRVSYDIIGGYPEILEIKVWYLNRFHRVDPRECESVINLANQKIENMTCLN